MLKYFKIWIIPNIDEWQSVSLLSVFFSYRNHFFRDFCCFTVQPFFQILRWWWTFSETFSLFLSIYFSTIIILYYNFNFVAFPSSRVFTSLLMWYFYLWQTYVDIINVSFHCWLNFLACLIPCKWLAVWK